MRSPFVVLALTASLSACVSTPPDYFRDRPGSTSAPTRPPPQNPVRPAPEGGEFIAPELGNQPGLQSVMGQNARALKTLFGPPRLEVKEGDALKLQFTGQACVLDIYLYPLRPGGEPSATHVEARRASDAADVDRAACARALRR